MAAPTEAIEQSVNVRKFSGVNTQYDPVFIGGQFLKASQNLFPNFTYRLSKRYGSPIYKTIPGCVGISDILATSYQGHAYFFAYAQTITQDTVVLFIDDGPQINLYLSPHSQLTGRFIRYGAFVYMGNGMDPIQQLVMDPVHPTVISLTPITDLDDPSTDPPIPASVQLEPIPANSPASIIPGAYAFAWATYNTATNLYTRRTKAPGHQVTLSAGNFLRFTAPAFTLAGNEVIRLFLAAPNQPVEFGFLQGDHFVPGQQLDVTAVDVNQNYVPQETNVLRTGNFFTLFLSRIVFGGDLGDASATPPRSPDPLRIKASGVILPGYESTTFNTGAFFPAFATIPMPEEVTAVGIASVTSGFDPQAPLIVHTSIRTTLYTGGDPFDPNGTASRVELSARIGCPGPSGIAITPYGYFFMSIDSVYMIPPGGSYPVDVGWPIADQVRSIPSLRRNAVVAQFHKGFVKFAFSRPGSDINDVQYWLDIRTGLTQPPSWWGPMIGLPISACTSMVDHPDEWDRGYGAVEQSGTIVLTHQPGRYADVYDSTILPGVGNGEPIESIFRTGTFDDGEPFIEKIFTRFRCIAHADDIATCNVTVITDSGRTWPIDPMIVNASGLSKWNHLVDEGLGFARWNHLVDQTATGGAEWTSFLLVEAQTVSPLVRPRGLSAEVVVTHIDDGDIEFRDFEMLYLPVDRKVRAGNPPTGS